MRATLRALADHEHDVVIVGGGIVGACAAWDAALRGLSVALVERDDFAGAASARCFKMVHGGIRYLQHGDLPRLRESSRERRALLRIAPHLVHPLPIVVPTYGRGMQSRVALRLALAVYDALTPDRNHGIPHPQRQIPPGRLLSPAECLSLFPWLRPDGLTGGGLFHDGHMPSPARLALAFIRSAVKVGAVAVNHTEAVDFLRRRDRVVGIRARDGLTGEAFDVRGRMVLNAAGPWAERLLDARLGVQLDPVSTFSRDAFIVVSRRLAGRHALALPARTSDPDALVSRGPRHLFLVPWRDCTLVGVWHGVHRNAPDTVHVTEADVAGFLDEVNAAPVSLRLERRDVCQWHAGLVLFGDNTPGSIHLSYGKRSRVVDHARTHGVDGLMTAIGVRYTTARAVAQHAIDGVVARLGRPWPASATEVTPLVGGVIDDLERFVGHAVASPAPGVAPDVMQSLVQSYGTEYADVLRHADARPSLRAALPGSRVIGAQVVHAVRAEMAVTLADVVFRRTDLLNGRDPGEPAVRACAALMADELGWTAPTVDREMARVWPPSAARATASPDAMEACQA